MEKTKMSTYLVGYDLDKPGQDYSDLYDFLKSFNNWWHHLDSTWLIESGMTTVEVRNKLKKYIDSNDEILVVNVSGDSWASYGFNERGTNWLKDNI